MHCITSLILLFGILNQYSIIRFVFFALVPALGRKLVFEQIQYI